MNLETLLVLIETYWNVNLDYAMNCDIVYRY